MPRTQLGNTSARFEELLDALVREAEQLSGVSTAEAHAGERPDRLGGLVLSLAARPFGLETGPLDPVRDAVSVAGSSWRSPGWPDPCRARGPRLP